MVVVTVAEMAAAVMGAEIDVTGAVIPVIPISVDAPIRNGDGMSVERGVMVESRHYHLIRQMVTMEGGAAVVCAECAVLAGLRRVLLCLVLQV